VHAKANYHHLVCPFVLVANEARLVFVVNLLAVPAHLAGRLFSLVELSCFFCTKGMATLSVLVKSINIEKMLN